MADMSKLQVSTQLRCSKQYTACSRVLLDLVNMSSFNSSVRIRNMLCHHSVFLTSKTRKTRENICLLPSIFTEMFANV